MKFWNLVFTTQVMIKVYQTITVINFQLMMLIRMVTAPWIVLFIVKAVGGIAIVHMPTLMVSMLLQEHGGLAMRGVEWYTNHLKAHNHYVSQRWCFEAFKNFNKWCISFSKHIQWINLCKNMCMNIYYRCSFAILWLENKWWITFSEHILWLCLCNIWHSHGHIMDVVYFSLLWLHI